MINRNLGKTERMIRLCLSFVIFLWLWNSAEMGVFEWIAAVCGVFLLLNALSSRCYLWYWLKWDSCDDDYSDCANDPCE